MEPLTHNRTDRITLDLLVQYTLAESYLWREMGERGLHKEDGWSIVEFTREAEDGTEVVMRPLHLYRAAPAGLECVFGVARVTEPVPETPVRELPGDD